VNVAVTLPGIVVLQSAAPGRDFTPSRSKYLR
jgi:hypothetical protein